MTETREYDSFEQLEKNYRGEIEKIYPWLKMYGSQSGHSPLEVLLLFLHKSRDREEEIDLRKELSQEIVKIAKRQLKYERVIETRNLVQIVHLTKDIQEEITFLKELLERKDADNWITIGMTSNDEEMDKKLMKRCIEREIKHFRAQPSYNLSSLEGRTLQRMSEAVLDHYRRFNPEILSKLNKDINEILYNEILSATERTFNKYLDPPSDKS